MVKRGPLDLRSFDDELPDQSCPPPRLDWTLIGLIAASAIVVALAIGGALSLGLIAALWWKGLLP